MSEVTVLLALLGIALLLVAVRGKTIAARLTFINLSPELKPARKISRKHLS